MQQFPMRKYLAGWLAVTAFLAYEYAAMNGVIHAPSIMRAIFGKKVMPNAGYPLSYKLGWIGFIVILATNGYILRKRVPALQKAGQLSNWLDFHIFCGILGPTLIVFHSNFRVGGLVAISFWSMMISFASGVVGRYFYIQLLTMRVDTKRQLAFYEDAFKKCQTLVKPNVPDEVLQRYKDVALHMAGATRTIIGGRAALPAVFMASIIGDLQLMTRLPPAPPGLPKITRVYLARYAVLRRQVATTGYYQRLMGYWHTFHQPFAIFMYLVAIIHIVAVHVFRVR